MLNTLLYLHIHKIENQLQLIYDTINYINNQEYKEESNPSNRHYSETTEENEDFLENQQEEEEIVIEHIPIPITNYDFEFELYLPELFQEQQTMADVNAVLVAVTGLTAALTAQNARATEKMIIPIKKFRGGDQDPVTWLRDFEVAAAANGLINERKIQVVRGYLEGPVALWFDERARDNALMLRDWENHGHDEHDFKFRFTQKFRTNQKVDRWRDELEELQQTGTLDEYTDKFYELLRKADLEDHIHNDNRVRMYRRGLKPELKKWVKVNADGTLGNTIEVARKAEEAEAETNSRTYHQAQTNSTNDMSTILEALQQ